MADSKARRSASGAERGRAKALAGAAREGRGRAKAVTRAEQARARNEGRQVTRQWMVRALLAATRHGLTIRELHDRLQEDGYACDLRTVRRDLRQLTVLGHTQRAETGRWMTAQGSRALGGVPIAQEEAIALLVAEQRLAPLGDAWLGGALKELRAKALASMNDVQRDFCLDAAKVIVANPRSCVKYADRANLLQKLEQACHDTERVRISHRSRGAPARERVIEPRRLLFRDGALYVIARDVEDGQHKKFALHRIERADVMEEEFFDPDPSFDPDHYANASFGLHHGDPVRAVVEFDEQVAYLFVERQFHPSQRVERLRSGVRVFWEVSGSTDLVRWLAGYAGHVRVVEPDWLREELHELHRRGLGS